MNDPIQSVLGTSPSALAAWLFFSIFAAFLLGMTCETLRIPKRLRPVVVAPTVLAACWALDSPWQLLPIIALLAAGTAWMLARMTVKHYVKVLGRDHAVNYSQVKGGIRERLHGEAAALRKALVQNDSPSVADAPQVSAEPASTRAPHAVRVGSARW